MSTLSFQDGPLQAGISHHLRHLQKDSNVHASGGNVQARDLFFNVDTFKIAAMAGKWLHSIRKKRQPNNLSVYVTGLPGKTVTLEINDSDTVEDLKALIEDKEEISLIQQRLFLDGVELEDGKTLHEYNVGKESSLHLVLQLQGGGCIAYKMHRECFDEEFHYDFTQIWSDEQLFARGGAPYIRPLGSMRYALKVVDKYGDNAWLGISNRQSVNGSIDGEWPVAYHGTTDPRAAEIVQSGGLDLSKGTAFVHGYGIYCTPDPEIALLYASPYKYNGKCYKLVLQVRVDPSRREIVPSVNYWIAKENDAIRPYGICVYPFQI